MLFFFGVAAERRVPLDRAKTQNNLGDALWTPGERESRTVRLEEGVTVLGSAARVSKRSRSAGLGDDPK
jgi:hypothetical protein